jgi:hypothetical protein
MSDVTPKDMLCKDCKHAFLPWHDLPNWLFFRNQYWYKCRRSGKTIEVEFNPVTGSKSLPADYKSCYQERGFLGDCGKEAKYWSPKHKKDLFKLLKR